MAVFKGNVRTDGKQNGQCSPRGASVEASVGAGVGTMAARMYVAFCVGTVTLENSSAAAALCTRLHLALETPSVLFLFVVFIEAGSGEDRSCASKMGSPSASILNKLPVSTSQAGYL